MQSSLLASSALPNDRPNGDGEMFSSLVRKRGGLRLKSKGQEKVPDWHTVLQWGSGGEAGKGAGDKLQRREGGILCLT